MAPNRKVPRAARSAASNRKRLPTARQEFRGNGTHHSFGNPGRAVVGIGASAGGLEALKRFFGAMPEKSGLAFVVVVHLDPAHKSLLAELLAHSTGLSVEQANDRQPLELDHVYVIPPNRTLTIDQGLIRLHEVEDRRALRGSIDHFFRSLAEAERDRAIAIVLSGTGTEGNLGVRAVKAAGGLVLAQTPDTAAQPGMPSNAIASGVVDAVLPPEKMPEILLAYMRKPATIQEAAVAQEVKSVDGLPMILGLLRARTKYDFRGYKKGTIQRRIERRMVLQQFESIDGYANFLRSHPEEVDRLFKDLLIGVTAFFRDTPAFEELASKVFPALIRNRDPDSPIRIWVPGCSTGEEAYSIAIVLAERLALANCDARAQVFATDLDEDALEIARAGTYAESIALDVEPQRLQRFFQFEDHRYTIAKSVRESVIFAVQNLTSDPPFSKLDLISCRNVLIYLEPDTQEKLLTLFHFALKPEGYLFLGSAEGIGPRVELFASISKLRRIFQRTGTATGRSSLDFPARALAATDGTRLKSKAAIETSVAALADEQLLEHSALAAVVVRSGGQIVRFYGGLERYMKLPSGEATLDALNLVREGLAPTVRAALNDAVRRNRETVLQSPNVKLGRNHATVRVTVKPIKAPKTIERLWLIIFEAEIARPSAVKAAKQIPRHESELVRRLEAELRAGKKEQQSLIEQFESGNEELKAANEEVLSMNEELQSTNEELTASKEELQSMNEELTTLNSQLQDKVHELTSVNDDLTNLLVSTDIATVFLDTELRIKRFTNAASQVLNLQLADSGRPLSHIATNLSNADLTREARSVIDKLIPIEREVASRDGRRYILRGLPYRTADKQVHGVVLTLVDVTPLKQVEQELDAAREQVSADLRRMTRLHELGEHLARPGDARSTLEEILRAAIEITDAAMGYIKECDEKGALTIAAQVGFDQPFFEHVLPTGTGTDGGTGHDTSIQQRLIVENLAALSKISNSSLREQVQAAGAGAMQLTPLFDRSGQILGMLSTCYRAPHKFEEAELRWLDLLARHAEGAIERRRINDALALYRRNLERRVIERTQWLTLLHDLSELISEAPTWDASLERVLRRLCEVESWQAGYVYLPDPAEPDILVPSISYGNDEHLQPFKNLSERQRYSRGQSLPGKVYADGVAVWIDNQPELLNAIPTRAVVAREVGLQSGVALPIVVGKDVIAVLELFSDHSRSRNDWFDNLMPAISDHIGRVLERERTTARMADLVWREQQQLLHTLHDALGQTLTGLGMLSSGLKQRTLHMEKNVTDTAAEIARQAQTALEQVRRLSRSLFPVEIDAKSLTAALRELASATESLHKIPVHFEGDVPEDFRDGAAATQLYRIAQEAVTNAIKHARATAISIQIDGRAGAFRLQIADNGIGINHAAPGNGVGLQIMRHRAKSIVGGLTIENGTQGGTTVTCVLRPVPTRRHMRTTPTEN